ncbi:CHASE3 domain-containing protein [Rhodococcus sp. USK10]|nr:CHASE3 domain-containing protein [Rhodococcus sp. USK10]
MSGRTANARRMSLRTLLWLAIGILVALFAVSAAFSVYGRLVVRASENVLSERLLPAQHAVSDLTTAYVDQETGQRGYVLTGDPSFLEPYDAGRDAAAASLSDLNALLAGDAKASATLDAVVEAANTWTAQASEPEILARRNDEIADEQVVAMTATGKELFDGLRSQLQDLDALTDERVTEQVDRVRSAQIMANVATALAFVLAIGTAIASLYLTRRLLTRPIERLVADIGAVAEGDYEREIGTDGPREVSMIGGAVDTMRTSLLTQNRQLVRAEHERTRHDEQTRMAADLHDLTIQRVFGLGLALTSLARRHPRLATDLDPLIDETDSIVRGLRAVIFDLQIGATELSNGSASLSAAVGEIVESSTAALGFTPDVCLDGPVDQFSGHDAGPELQAVLREALSNVARHAHATSCRVMVAADDDRLALSVTDDGTGMGADVIRGHGLANICNRAAQLGGRAVIRDGAPGTVVEWEVPAS